MGQRRHMTAGAARAWSNGHVTDDDDNERTANSDRGDETRALAKKFMAHSPPELTPEEASKRAWAMARAFLVESETE